MTDQDHIKHEVQALSLILFLLHASGLPARHILENLKQEDFLLKLPVYNLSPELYKRIVRRLENIIGENQGAKG
jgi:hypothetical protein